MKQTSSRILIEQDPYIANIPQDRPWHQRGLWPCRWICCPTVIDPPFVTAYRIEFKLDDDVTIRTHVSADERYELFLDGQRIGRGSERGDRFNWFYETYDLRLAPGNHVIVAKIWSLGDKASYAQMSVSPGFLFSPEEPFVNLLGTGVAEWKSKQLGGYSFDNAGLDQFAWFAGPAENVDGFAFSWDFEKGEGDKWQTANCLHYGANGFIHNEYSRIHMLKPALLPQMIEKEIFSGKVRLVSEIGSKKIKTIPVDISTNLLSEVKDWDFLVQGRGSVSIPAYTFRRIIIDLQDYYCAYPCIVVSNGEGSNINVSWTEALYDNDKTWSKGHREHIDKKIFFGIRDIFKTDGGKNRKFETLWWRAGRYVEIIIETSNQPLVVESLSFSETRYPMEMQSHFNSDDCRINNLPLIAQRTIQMCSHETYFDCPYYEQLMYAGDARLEALTTYLMTTDDRLTRKSIMMFNVSRLNSGLTQSRYPSRVTQIIPPFSLWWVAMVYDYALWRGDKAFIKEQMSGVRGVIDYHLTLMNQDGLMRAPNGWNFVDWAIGWDKNGIPHEAEFGISSILNWHFVLALKMASQLENWVGEKELAARDARLSANLSNQLILSFWNEREGLFSDDLSGKFYSEHAQCLAVLSGYLDCSIQKRLVESLRAKQNIRRVTIYFMHYLFEAYKYLGCMDLAFEKLTLWFDMANNGLKTFPERPEPSRSDCHGWSAHILYHLFASVLGVRPVSMGFDTVDIQPYLGSLTRVDAVLVHPRGQIKVAFCKKNGALESSISLPDGTTGVIKYAGQQKIIGHGLTKHQFSL